MAFCASARPWLKAASLPDTRSHTSAARMLSTLGDCARILASQQRSGGDVLHGPAEIPCATTQHGDSTRKATAAASATATRRGHVLRTRTSEARTSSAASGSIAAALGSVPRVRVTR